MEITAVNSSSFYIITNPDNNYISIGSKGGDVLFQKEYGLAQDGIAGAKTLKQLNTVINTAKNNVQANKSDTVSISGNLQKGSKGEAVTDLQNSLKKLGYFNSSVDGDFGDITKAAVVRFQKDKALTQDGIAGNQTKSAISSTITELAKTTTVSTSSNLQVGSSGNEVKQLQADLTLLGYNTYGIDGQFGQNTKNAVIAFQKTNGLTQDGIVGIQTKNAINNELRNKARN